MPIKYAITRSDDTDRHDLGCECGCSEILTGRTFGVGIFTAEGTDDLAVENAILSDDPVERIYACSPNSARHNAKMRLEQLGYAFPGDI